MSWLTEFTSKAETFLNKIDQSAAHTLNESSLAQHNDVNDSHIGEINIIKEPQQFKQNESELHKPDATKINKPLNKTFEPPKSNISSSKKLNHSADTKGSAEKGSANGVEESNLVRSTSSPSLKKQDELLFEFLNSNNPVTTKTHVRNLSGPKTSTPRKTASLTSTAAPSSHKPTGVTQGIVAVEGNRNADAVDNLVSPSVPVKSNVPSDKDEKGQSMDQEDGGSKESKVIDANKQIDDRISNLELENKLLKNEMHSLNEELSSTLKTLKEQQQETEKYKLRYENRRSQQNEDYDRIQKQYESRETDLNEALKAKDSQLAVLKVRLKEVDDELAKKSNMFESVQVENERLLKDHSDASGVHSVAFDNLKQRLEEAETQLRKEKTENNSVKSELISLQTKLQDEQHQYAETIKQLQSRQTEGKGKSRELELMVKSAEGGAEVARKELKDYKDKASRILQAKERLIASLRQGTDSSEASPLLLSELEEAKQERDLLKDELQQNKYKTEQLRSEYLDLELLHNTESNDNDQKIESLQSALQEECQKRKSAEEDMKRYMQELQFTREDLHKQKKTQLALKQEHEAELKKMQQQVASKVRHTSNSSQEELENRIRTLTDSLIHKQTMVEALSTEKNSLVLQLERLEKQYHDVQNSLSRRNKDHHNDDLEDPESGSRLQPMASIMPSQITQNLHWKKTVNDIDKFSIRLGVFLRRYPIARLMIIFYVFILHLWVTFVLLTYTPEIHGSHDQPPR